jgi:hypothetical protein
VPGNGQGLDFCRTGKRAPSWAVFRLARLMRPSGVMRRMVGNLRRSRLHLVVLAVLWLPMLATPCIAEGPGCHVGAAQHGHRDRAPLPARGCCTVSGGSCVAEVPAPGVVMDTTVALALIGVAMSCGMRSVSHATPSPSVPRYLRFRVLLI